MRFEPNRPFETTSPRVVVDAGLDAGPHRFQLVVVNARGQHSEPTEVTVTVVRLGPLPLPLPTPLPTPVITRGPVGPIR